MTDISRTWARYTPQRLISKKEVMYVKAIARKNMGVGQKNTGYLKNLVW